MAQGIQPIFAAQAGQPGQVELGKKLYFDPRLSKSGFISCNSCHNLSMGGTDNIPRPSATSGSRARSTRRRC
jgi:cytochrome c peroxidase